MSRKGKIFILVGVDTILTFVGSLAAFYFLKPYVSVSFNFLNWEVILSIGLYLFFGYVFNVFNRINRYTNLREIIAITLATALSAVVQVGIFEFMDGDYSRHFVFFSFLVSLVGIIASRLAWRLLVEQKIHKESLRPDAKRTLIVGAGEGGRILLNSLSGSKTSGDIMVVGFIDDNVDRYHTYLSNKKVLGATKDLPALVKEYDIEMVTIAIPSLEPEGIQRILDILEPLHVKINSMPAIEEMAFGDITVSKLKEIDVIDLLGREEVQLDMATIKDQLANQTILVTGAGGSIGSEISRQVMRFNPKKLILLGHGENSIYLIEKELKTKYRDKLSCIIPVIADVQDREKMMEVMQEHQPDIVYHAAAHKHVPLMEANPYEAVKNNVYGTKNVAEAAKANNVKNFVMISTDKAVNPPNVMGSTKRIAEMIVMGLNEPGKTKFSAVRFGNVLGSRGSVIPVFKEQIQKGGPITVTDFRMTRYFMTIPEASRLVIQSGALARGGEIFILDMGEPVKIVDLAKNMIKLSGYTEKDIPIVESGIRPGEKLYEELLVSKEVNPKQVFEKIFIGNVKGFSLEKVMTFVEELPEDKKLLAEELVRFANESSK
ncbi:short-chain dehydrogenase [Enterococcus sp. JM4C]|uniref:polysaccharide biosynthesis protein n=1 Tax=Candidatus Enterococcus huntleyi TaxID=1857217 RepID=UPI00137A549A|nr:nucleoside-diphosphate sugar epimerase/dehydratase [Enterococcus sp. JM4C]KAF1298827.1 short-chain dehydrogenase [Enterococcus sp. JM4C]